MKVTFLNENSEKNLEEIGRASLQRQALTMTFYMHFEVSHTEFLEDNETSAFDDFWDDLKDLYTEHHLTSTEVGEMLGEWEDNPVFSNYGLAWTFYEPEHSDEEPYYMYQISWGGPSSEIRFYVDDRIEYVYKNWFCGVGFDVSEEAWAIWLRDYFNDIDDFQTKLREYISEND